MEYFLSFLFLGLHLVDYEYNIPGPVFLILSGVLFLALFHVSYKKTKDFLCTCIVMFCHTWQSSWINVFGDFGSPLQITWFYMVGVLILAYCMVNIKKVMTNGLHPATLAMFVSLFIFLPYPLIISPSVSEGIKELLMIAFFFVISFVAYIFRNTIPFEKRDYIVKAYVFQMIMSCAFLLVQYFAFTWTGKILFNYSVGNYYGNLNASSKLLMEDTSCTTIMIGATMFYLLERFSKKHWYIYVLLGFLLMAGLGVTTRRTSIVSLAVILVAYVFLHYKSASKRISMIIAVVAIMSVMFIYLYFARSIDNLDHLLDWNGRLEIYSNALNLIVRNPFGVGYDNVNILNQVGGMVPHNTMLRWLCMGGIPFGIIAGTLVVNFVVFAYKKKCKTEMWFLIYALFASNFIPDILNARLLIVPVMMVFLLSDMEEENEESITVQSRNEF